MEAVRAWGASLCWAAVACAALQLLAPKGGLGKLLEVIGAMTLLCCALSPLVTLPSWDWNLISVLPLSDTAQNELLQTRLYEQLDPVLQDAVQEEGERALASYGLTAEKIEAVMDTDENGGIYISKIAVTLSEKQAVRKTAVAQILKERFNVDVEVTVSE